MKKIEWIDGDHMLFESDHKTFNKQANIVSTGNMISNVQRSSYIRPRNETSCGSITRPPGHLRRFDLDNWKWMPNLVHKKVIEFTEDDPVILYEFFHWSGRVKVTHGWVITDTDYNLLFKLSSGPTYKSWSVIDEAIKYITKDERDAANAG